MIYYRKTLFGSGPKLTAVQYADLIARKITIGVANQERQLLIFDARMKRMAIKFKNN